MIYLELFLGFLEVGCFSFGGAYAAIPLIRDVVLRYGWLSEETLLYFIAVSESTPGPIIVNLATYIGSSQAGILGALLATGTVALPAFLIILGVVAVLDRFLKNPYVKAVMDGLKPCVAGVVLAMGAEMILTNVLPEQQIDLPAVVVTAVLGAVFLYYRLVKKKKAPSIPLIVLSAILGMVVYCVF